MNFLKGRDETLDSFYHGKLLVLQKKKGFRFSADAPLLADFIDTQESDELLELGAGNGIISLLVSIKPFRQITAVEIQDSLVDLARRNLALNHLEARVSLIQADLRDLVLKKKFDVVFSNPPYIRRSAGQLSASEEKSIAKHELKCDIFGIMHKTSELLKDEGRAYFIYPERREEDFKLATERSGLKVRVTRQVFPRPEEKANLFLASCGFKPGRKAVLPSLILYDEKGKYTAEAREIFAGRAHGQAPS